VIAELLTFDSIGVSYDSGYRKQPTAAAIDDSGYRQLATAAAISNSGYCQLQSIATVDAIAADHSCCHHQLLLR
jgi:hypothetical protein